MSYGYKDFFNVFFFSFLACTANNNIKIFTSNLEDEGGIIGFSTLATSDKMIWHQDSTSLVLIGPTKHHLQFFDPLERRQKFALEIISQNIILGEREGVYIFYLLSIRLSFLLSDLNLGNSTCHLVEIRRALLFFFTTWHFKFAKIVFTLEYAIV